MSLYRAWMLVLGLSLGVNAGIDQEELFPRSSVIIEQLRAQNYAVVPFSLSHEFLSKTMVWFSEFLASRTEDNRFAIKAKLPGPHRRGDLGLVRRTQNPNDMVIGDQKYFFHYHPFLSAAFHYHKDVDEKAANFLAGASLIWEAVYDIVKKTLSAFKEDDTLEGLYSKILNTKKQDTHLVLRFLYYDVSPETELDPKSSEHYLARPHFDAGSLTFALGESGPGLRIRDPNNIMQAIEHHEKQALLFLGNNIENLLGKKINPLRAAWHDVVRGDETTVSATCARWSIVAFVDGFDTTGATAEANHKILITPPQEWKVKFSSTVL